MILSSKQMDVTQAVLDGVNKSLKDVKLKASTKLRLMADPRFYIKALKH